MINKIKENKLWIVTFYKEDDEKDWETIIAKTEEEAIKAVKYRLRSLYGLEKGEKLYCNDFDTCEIEGACNLHGKVYQINLEIKKEK